MRHVRRILLLVSVIILACGYLVWNLRPVVILRVGGAFEYDLRFKHGLYKSSQRGFTDTGYYDVVVDHMPLTEWGRINWYLEHKTELKKKYNIIGSSSYSLTFWGIGDGFIDGDKSGDGDLYCFAKTDSDANCLEKNLLLSVDYSVGEQEKFTFIGDCGYWVQHNNGRLEWYKGWC